MTGPEHYRQAEQLLEAVRGQDDLELAAAGLAAAQVHATLALAAAAYDAALAHGGEDR